MGMSEFAARIKGMAEMIDFDENDKKDKLLLALIDAFDSIAETVDTLDEDVDAMYDQLACLEDDVDAVGVVVDEIDHDLGDLEEEVYGDCCDDGGCSCGCGNDCHCPPDCECGCNRDRDYAEAKCPCCGCDIAIDIDALEEGEPIACPECGEQLDFEIVEDEDDFEE